MQNLPQIFNGAKFIEPPADVLASLDPPTLERLNGVRTAFQNLEAANAAEAAAIQNINDCLEAENAAEDYRAIHYPASTPHDEWILNFGSAEARKELAQRRRG